MPVIKYNDLELIRAPFAVQPTDARRLYPTAESHDRTPTQRDRDRVIHSSSFRMLKGKTQVYIDGMGDFYRTRLTHSIEVSQIARSLARTLQLDEDLAETCALAHDIGHPPFGHTGEDALDECMQPIGGFDHNEQALRTLMVLEKPYSEHPGLNLCWDTLEGILKHNGPLKQSERGATIKRFDEKMQLRLDGHASLEAQMAAVADDIAYNAHDVDDAHRAGLLSYEQIRNLPFYKEALAEVEAQMWAEDERRRVSYAVRHVIGEWVADVLAFTRANLAKLKPETADDIRNAGYTVGFFADATWARVKVLKKAMLNDVYKHPKVAEQREGAMEAVRGIFDALIHNPDLLPPEFRHSEENIIRCIGDYIGGMTDIAALQTYARLSNKPVMKYGT